MYNLNGSEANLDQLPNNTIKSSQHGSGQHRSGVNQTGHLMYGRETPDKLMLRDIINDYYVNIDEFSLIEAKHPRVVDVQKPNHNPFRSNLLGSIGTKVILDKSGKFGPLRFIKLDVHLMNERQIILDIQQVHILESTHGNGLEWVRQEKEVEGLSIPLVRGDIFSPTQLESMASLDDCETYWEDRPEYQLFELLQYWAFHHHEAVNLMAMGEIDYD